MLFIGGLILTTGIALAYITISSVNAGYGFQASERAEAAAVAGAEDALVQLDRNAAFAYASPGYSFSVGSSTATVIVQQNTPSAGLVTVNSTGVVSGRTRTVKVVVSDNPTTAQISLISWQDIQ